MKILVAGDFCPRYRVTEKFNKGDFKSILEEVRQITEQTDYSIVNLECPVVTGSAKPIEKLGPSLRCSPQGVKAIRWSGFNCVTLANNHFMDYGVEGAEETLKTLEEMGVDHVGGGMNLSEASQILYKNINGCVLAVVNCCEHEFSIATRQEAGSNPLNPIQQYYAIREARKHADHVLVIVHGGHEHFQLPSPRMVEVYRFFIDAGADVVVNHHQHCFSGYEVYKGKPIFYGIGNLCFDNPLCRQDKWTEGYMVTFDLNKDIVSFVIHPYQQCTTEPRVVLLSNNAFEEKLNELNSTIADSIALSTAVDNYYASSSAVYGHLFEPLFNRYYFAAMRHLKFPSLIGKKRKLSAANFIFCEAHRDKLMWWLRFK